MKKNGKKAKSKVLRAKEKKAHIKLEASAVAASAGPGLAFSRGRAWRAWDEISAGQRRRVLVYVGVTDAVARLLAPREWYALPLWVRRGVKRATRHSADVIKKILE